MHHEHHPDPDWDPFSIPESTDQRDVYDAMRARGPLAYSERLHWSVLRHDDVMRILLDPETFSNQVSRHLSVPNGMDPPEHTLYRKIIVPYFSEDRLRAFEPVCSEIVADLTTQLLVGRQCEFISTFALKVAVQIHCAFLGWPPELRDDLADWAERSRAAARANDQSALARVSREFQELVADMVAQRRAIGAPPEMDSTAALMHETVDGRPLDDIEIASILRNWTVGEIGTMSASIGIVVHFLATHPDLQDRLRAEPSLLPAAIDEILRLQGPLVTNRRVTTCRVEIGGRTLAAGERISLNWVSANRDECAFADPAEFSLERDPSLNLLYGAGIHVCPGAPLARLELRLVIGQLLASTETIELDSSEPPTLAGYPASGFATLPVALR